MTNNLNTTAWPAFAWGVLAGMRSLSAPAFMAHYLSQSNSPILANSPMRFLQNAKVATSLKVLAGTEVIGDKWPRAPNRIAAPVLLVRILSGALVGAAYSLHQHQSWRTGALLGGAGAVAGSYSFFYLRTSLSKNTPAPDLVYALLEDALVLTGGISLANASLKKKID